MSEHSSIEWTDATWNPVRGCIRVSPGCKHCYAEAFAERFRGVKGHPYERGFDVRLVPDKLLDPLAWSSSKVVFVNSMSDLFQEEVPDQFILAVAGIMKLANWHTYQVLTKRSERLRALLNGKLREYANEPHIWWGVSVEDRRYGLPRIEHLRQTSARVRFLSVEPLLEDLGAVDFSGIDWVIVGGESGRHARPMASQWVDRLLRAARAGNAAFFFKQWGGVHKKRAGRLLGGKTYDELPPVRRAEIPSRTRRMEMIASLATCAITWSGEERLQGLLAKARISIAHSGVPADNFVSL